MFALGYRLSQQTLRGGDCWKVIRLAMCLLLLNPNACWPLWGSQCECVNRSIIFSHTWNKDHSRESGFCGAPSPDQTFSADWKEDLRAVKLKGRSSESILYAALCENTFLRSINRDMALLPGNPSPPAALLLKRQESRLAAVTSSVLIINDLVALPMWWAAPDLSLNPAATLRTLPRLTSNSPHQKFHRSCARCFHIENNFFFLDLIHINIFQFSWSFHYFLFSYWNVRLDVK